ncbi:sensor domain-containing diguanylate cyclase/phosphohydrolase [Clostridium saudiense]|uniref:sensor domain-containing diguanylate cyclase/phosphohydrolase n=3 Tax=Clostridium saudiense TaxID=1414720 RepID=UPI00319E9AE1
MISNMEIFEVLEHPIWIKNSKNKVLFINSSFKNTFNLNENFNYDILIKHLNDKDEYAELLKTIVNEKSSNSNSFTYKNKSYKYKISTYFDNNEKILIGSIIEDIEVLNTNEKLMLRTVIDNIPSLVFYKDKDLKYIGINKACEKFYNEKGVYDIIGKNDLEFPLEEEFKEICYKHDNIVLNTKEPLYIEEKVFSSKENMVKTFQTIKTPVINNSNEIIGLVGLVRDVTEYKLNEEKLTYLSYVDSLTTLYNRSYFDKKIEEHIKEELFPIGIISGDVNGLKLVNDTFGHNEGDKLLKRVAECLKECCSDLETPFRFGGDEFCIIVPSASSEKCTNIINSINEKCSNYEYSNIGTSISLGFALLEREGCIDSVLCEADDKAYKQKIFDSKTIRVSTLERLKEDLNKKKIETEEHTERVMKLSEKVGKEMNLTADLIDQLSLLGRLHDIGKIAIPDYILLKSQPLTESEFEIVKTHSEKGYRLAQLLPEFSHIARGILTHHERWDGTGYPLGLKGEEIPLIARIVSVVDSYDSIINDKVYSKGRNKQEAIEELRRCSGKQFDPNIVEVFCKVISKN